MLDYDDLDLFDALETISLMDDYEFEKTRLEFEKNGYILKRDKNENGDANITVEKKQYLYKDSVQKLHWVFSLFIQHIKKNNSKRQSINGKEFDTYKVGTVANSCSTMHKIAEKEFTLEDFSCEHLSTVSLNYLRNCIEHLNFIRDVYNEDKSNKGAWWQMIQLLPSSYNQTRNVMMNYEVLANIYQWRKDHKLDEWREFCKWIERLPYSELITGLPIESDDADED